MCNVCKQKGRPGSMCTPFSAPQCMASGRMNSLDWGSPHRTTQIPVNEGGEFTMEQGPRIVERGGEDSSEKKLASVKK